MAQKDVFMTEDDLERVVHFLLSFGCTIIPDLNSETTKLTKIDSLAQFRELRLAKAASLFFVLSNQWEVAPMEFGSFDQNGRTVYFVRQKTGGPTLDIFAPFSFHSHENRIIIPHGFIAYHASFWNPLSQSNEKAPQELKEIYQQVLKVVGQHTTQIANNGRKYFVTRRVSEDLAHGASLGPPFSDVSNK